MSEAFHPLRYLDYWERTSPQERCNRRPAYEEHDNRKADYPKVYEEHDHRKVDYAKLYSQPKPPVQRQRSNPSPESLSAKQRQSPLDEPSDAQGKHRVVFRSSLKRYWLITKKT